MQDSTNDSGLSGNQFEFHFMLTFFLAVAVSSVVMCFILCKQESGEVAACARLNALHEFRDYRSFARR